MEENKNNYSNQMPNNVNGARPVPAGARPVPAGARPVPNGTRPVPAGARPMPNAQRPQPAPAPVASATAPAPQGIVEGRQAPKKVGTPTPVDPKDIKVNKPKKDKKEIIFIVALLAFPLLHFLIFWVYVNANTIVMSFQDLDYEKGKYVFNKFDTFERVIKTFIQEKALRGAIVNSMLFFLWNNLIILPISLFCAFFLFKKMPLANTYRIIFFLPSLISIVVLTLSFKFIFDDSFGVVNEVLRSLKLDNLIPEFGWFQTDGVAIVMILMYCLWAGIGYNIVLLTGAISRIPGEIFESGRIDGLGIFRELWYIVVPLVGTTISTLFVYGTTVIFTIFLQPLLLAGKDNESTWTVALYIVQRITDGQLNDAAAIGVLCALIGTPIVMVTRWLMDKLFPTYEY